MLKVEWEGSILRATIDRPEVRNALNDQLLQQLGDLFAGAARRARVIIFGGIGKSFCSGGDLEWMARAANYSEEQNKEDALALTRVFEAMLDCPGVIIAKVHGSAYGGGAGLVCMADVAIASDETIFAFSEVRLGLVAATISPHVIRKIGSGHARALFATGEAFGSERALRIGLVHEVTTLEELPAAVEQKAALVLKAGPEAVADSKRLTLAEPMTAQEAAALLAKARSRPEGKEGVSAFLEKRTASFVEGH